jgi:hypothetical protein
MTSVDINYDFRKDLDVDKDSYKLKKYHKILWSKELPNKEIFSLDTTKGEYLIFHSNSNRIRLSSDWIINTYLHWNYPSIDKIKKQISVYDYDNFNKLAYTIGSYIIFPLDPIDTPSSTYTINTGRCQLVNCKIKDRFDLTLECIRRYYLKKENPFYNEENPLSEVICDFAYYFDLFVNFKEFCDFYLLQDLTKNNYSEIKYFLTFNSFSIDPFPKNVDDYREYMKKATEFIIARNKRIDDYIKSIKL